MAYVNNNHLALPTQTTELPGVWVAVGPGACCWAAVFAHQPRATGTLPVAGLVMVPGLPPSQGPLQVPVYACLYCIAWTRRRGTGPGQHSLAEPRALPVSLTAWACWPARRVGLGRRRRGPAGGPVAIWISAIWQLPVPGLPRSPGGCPGAWAWGRTPSPSRTRMTPKAHTANSHGGSGCT